MNAAGSRPSDGCFQLYSSEQPICRLHLACPDTAAAAGVKVSAFDKDPKRLRRLQANIDRTGAGHIVTATQADFLSIDPQAPQFAKVGWCTYVHASSAWCKGPELLQDITQWCALGLDTLVLDSVNPPVSEHPTM